MLRCAMRQSRCTKPPRNAFYHDQAAALLCTLDHWYLDDEGTGYFLTASDCDDVPIRIRGDVDEAMPSATSQIIEAMMRTANLTGDAELHQKAWSLPRPPSAGRSLSPTARPASSTPVPCPVAHEAGHRRRSEQRQSDQDRKRHPIPAGSISCCPWAHKLRPPSLPGGVYPDTSSGAWLCTAQICLPAITDPAELEQALDESRL